MAEHGVGFGTMGATAESGGVPGSDTSPGDVWPAGVLGITSTRCDEKKCGGTTETAP